MIECYWPHSPQLGKTWPSAPDDFEASFLRCHSIFYIKNNYQLKSVHKCQFWERWPVVRDISKCIRIPHDLQALGWNWTELKSNSREKHRKQPTQLWSWESQHKQIQCSAATKGKLVRFRSQRFKVNRKKMMAYAQKYNYWSLDQWKSVIGRNSTLSSPYFGIKLELFSPLLLTGKFN